VTRARRRRMRLAFVVPWFPDGGGAEIQARETVLRLHQAGHDVEVLTSCARSYFADWSVNAFPAGVERWRDVPVRRFPVLPVDRTLLRGLATWVERGGVLAAADQEALIAQLLRVPALPEWLATHARDYDFVLFTPYLSAASVSGGAACPARAVLVPCLHDEPFAYLAPVRAMFRAAAGVLCFTEAERVLALALYDLDPDRVFVTGAGVDPPPAVAAAEADGDGYLVAVGRREPGKNFPLLLEWFRVYRRRRADGFRLVLVGHDPISPPLGDEPGVVDAGALDEGAKARMIAGATAVCQLSVRESFSRVLMEGWSLGTPAIVHAGCAVTRLHCLESGGGIPVADAAEFGAAVDVLREQPAVRRALGARGRAYVTGRYAWPVVVAEIEAALERLAAFSSR
jgi:glycosyltransferase involved in cell wall biosynthesis